MDSIGKFQRGSILAKKELSPAAAYEMVSRQAMSEFKFACPVCGQHITADSSASGGQLECPTCFRKIVIPQAPSNPDAKFIVSAAEVGKPRPMSTPNGGSTDVVQPARSGVPIALIVGIVVLL